MTALSRPAPTPSRGLFDGSVHRYALRVFYDDTDAGGVVYHANYIRWMERARSDLVDLLGIDQRRALEEGTGLYTVAELTIRYRSPARLGDEVMIETLARSVGRVTCLLDQRVVRGETLLAEATVKIGFIDAHGKPTRQPRAWQDAFLAILAETPSTPSQQTPDPNGPEGPV